MGGLSTSDAAVNEIYASILSQAAEYRQLQLDLEQLDSRLNLLENEYPTLRKESDEMAQRLDDAARALDAQAEEVVALLEEIAQENHLNITFSAEQEEVAVQIDHTTRPATRQEAFAAFVLFFGLTGVCVGGFTAVCRVYSSKKENLPQQ